MKWLVQYPNDVIPAISYSLIYLLTSFALKWLFVSVIKEHAEYEKDEQAFNYHSKAKMPIFRVIPIVLFVLLLVLAYFLPEVAIVCFIIFPVVMSLANVIGN